MHYVRIKIIVSVYLNFTVKKMYREVGVCKNYGNFLLNENRLVSPHRCVYYVHLGCANEEPQQIDFR